MKLLNGDDLRKELKSALKKATSARFCVAYWGKGAIKTLAARKGKVEVICDLLSGGTNPYEIIEMRKAGVAVKHLASLHAKFAVVGEWAYVGSSNISANGLGQEGQQSSGLIELNCAFTDRAVVASLNERWEKLDSAAVLIDNKMLNTAIENWKVRQLASLKTNKKNATLGVNQLPKSTHVAIYRHADKREVARMDAMLQKMRNEAQPEKQLLFDDIDLFSDWQDLPEGVPLICFAMSSEQGLEYEGIWVRIDDPSFKVPGRTKDRYQVAQRQPYKISSKTIQVIETCAKNWEGLKRAWDNGGAVALIEEIIPPEKYSKLEAFGAFGAEFSNIRWSWSGRSRDQNTVALTFWLDQWDENSRIYDDTGWGNDQKIVDRNGNKERRENIKWAIDHLDGIVRIVMAEAKNPNASPKEALRYWPDRSRLMRIVYFNQKTGEFKAEAVAQP
ncbi:hypothetical protein DEM27_06450 [Metarhizobium album]|uniref:Phospholipase D-like domain-containing protein n=1 Tax=Metarhizobium album TaxID=2182425 RepID=A0A2U2DVB8_9HYPH|nr:phospholipase D-like domain-containing protein [Rhizobium album]PWE57273.1 hypothetical protein DEM27_06450 [Rhizobium album]